MKIKKGKLLLGLSVLFLSLALLFVGLNEAVSLVSILLAMVCAIGVVATYRLTGEFGHISSV